MFGFYLVSLVSHLTSLGDLNISIMLMMFLILIMLLGERKISLEKFIYLGGFFLLVCGLTFASENNINQPINALGRSIKVVLVFIPIFISIKPSPNLIMIFLKGFVFSACCMLVPSVLLITGDEGYLGAIRLSSYLTDANYFALISLILYLSTNEFMGVKKYRACLLIFIILSQSITIMALTATIKLAPFIYRVIRPSVRWMPFLLAFSWILMVYWIGSFAEVSSIKGYDISFVDMKLNSVFFRLIAQIQALQQIFDEPQILLFGYGSGHSVDLFGRVLHNFYLQLFFDSGIILSIIILSLISYSAVKSVQGSTIFMVLLFCALMFDPFFMYIFTFWLLVDRLTYRIPMPRPRGSLIT